MKALTNVFFLIVLRAGAGFAQTPFYEGKTIRIVVGLPAGDAYDLYARMLATYMANTFPAIRRLSCKTCRAPRA